MHSAAALFLSLLASAGTPAATVQGTVEMRVEGRSLDCVGALLIPRSSQTEALVEQHFGKLDEGTRITPTSYASRARPDAPEGSRRSRCIGRFSERFEFSDVPPGEYYLTVAAVHKSRGADGAFRPRTIEMMRSVSVGTTNPVKADFTYTD